MYMCVYAYARALRKKTCSSIYIKFDGQPLPVVNLHVISHALSRTESCENPVYWSVISIGDLTYI